MNGDTNFKDYFSTHAVAYAKYRPRYPAELFGYLASVAPARSHAWDCATGNGQAAPGLANFFERVTATDASRSQIEQATRHERIAYEVAPAEQSGIESATVDLITVAQAFHWFDFEGFYAEARRVLVAEGVLAVWCYNLLEISPPLDAVISRFYDDTVGEFWPPERRLLAEGYRTINFPFAEFDAPSFHMTESWTLTDLTGYLGTWSATKRFIAARGFDPLESLAAELSPLWGNPDDPKPVRWPLSMRIGRARRR